ncbi:hypothetical protein BD626DRAFT_398433 [Schizophyllum amplum]|uniref:C2H2-type domain-containing protein n=1 Tax=Schizophyllum amplum TaxID=97359 RepID=A0A550CN86_9AGAR|nr:hypothetical protein BD626DRAFT_398433 [Auriculariopsis ampla]
MAYCDRCERYFPNSRALYQHESNSPYHNICEDCDRDFPTYKGLKEHWVQSPRHAYCQYCDEHFYDRDDLEDHYEGVHSYCRKCRRVFINERGLEEHYRQSEAHYYCEPCKRDFKSYSNLQSHLNSSIHRPRDIICPFKGCGQGFISLSALAAHCENGRCPSGVDRRTVDRFIRNADKSNYITDPSRMITNGDADTRIRNIATSATWNGYAYECYLCSRMYSTLRDLNKHLSSPYHASKVYKCPMSSCSYRSTTVSALFSHVEAGNCGVRRFTPIQGYMNDLVDRMGRARITG